MDAPSKTVVDQLSDVQCVQSEFTVAPCCLEYRLEHPSVHEHDSTAALPFGNLLGRPIVVHEQVFTWPPS